MLAESCVKIVLNAELKTLCTTKTGIEKILIIDSRDNRLLWTSGLPKIVFAYEISVRERELSIRSLLNSRREFV